MACRQRQRADRDDAAPDKRGAHTQRRGAHTQRRGAHAQRRGAIHRCAARMHRGAGAKAQTCSNGLVKWVGESDLSKWLVWSNLKWLALSNWLVWMVKLAGRHDLWSNWLVRSNWLGWSNFKVAGMAGQTGLEYGYPCLRAYAPLACCRLTSAFDHCESTVRIFSWSCYRLTSSFDHCVWPVT